MTGAFLFEHDAFRHKRESRMQKGAGFPGSFASVFLMQRASSAKLEEFLVLASIQDNVNSSTAAKQMRRFFGTCGGAGRQDVLVGADMDLPSEGKSDHAEWPARCKAKKKREIAKKEDGEL